MSAPLRTDASLRDAVSVIEATTARIAVVVDELGQVAGTLTDGDIRRALLDALELDAPVTAAMNRSPVIGDVDMPKAALLELLRSGNLESLPLVDADGSFSHVVHVTDFDAPPSDEASGFWGAVIMAGGKGERLQPLTEHIPKPMIEVGGVPLMENIVRSLVGARIKRIFVAVNYMGHVIEDHFGNGAAYDAHIEYLRESEPRGTAGPLSLLEDVPQGPLLVVNGDVLTGSDFRSLLDFHSEQAASITVGVVRHRVEIPYGVLETDGARAVSIEEKPSRTFLCNAGIYAASPETISTVPSDRAYDMTDLIRDLLDAGKHIAVFPIHEHWTDIGTPLDLERARDHLRQRGD